MADDGNLVLLAVRKPLLRDLDGKDAALEHSRHTPSSLDSHATTMDTLNTTLRVLCVHCGDVTSVTMRRSRLLLVQLGIERFAQLLDHVLQIRRQRAGEF